jgi:hypothetical protein
MTGALQFDANVEVELFASRLCLFDVGRSEVSEVTGVGF